MYTYGPGAAAAHVAAGIHTHYMYTHTHGPGGAAGDIAAGVYGGVSRAEVAASSVGVERDRGAARRAGISTHTHTHTHTHV
jgi:hypothetical protein